MNHIPPSSPDRSSQFQTKGEFSTLRICVEFIVAGLILNESIRSATFTDHRASSGHFLGGHGLVNDDQR